MCFEFGCFGGGRREDYGGDRPAARKPRVRRGNRRNDEHSGGAGDHKAYHSQPQAAATVDESGHKAYHDDGARKDHHHADAGGHGRYTAYVLDKQVDYYDTPKLPAWHNKVSNDNDNDNTYTYTYTYTARPGEDEAAPGPRQKQNAAMDYHHYPTAAANTATLMRYE
uniref:Uncharacterized protein n=1 Tax=Avena sativa TaxID=4498 RepID=A0ACD5VMI0_AVESA